MPKTSKLNKNPNCRLQGKGEWNGNEYQCNGQCATCGHDEAEYQRRRRYIREYGLTELPNGLKGLKVRRNRANIAAE